MVIDTSALVAMLTDEPEAEHLELAVETDQVRLMSVASYVETAIVIETRFGDPGGRELDLWLHRAAVDLVNVDSDQADIARVAYRTYGKGRHRAGLNYGECFSYALAKISGQPLLFKGDDFAHTDIRVVSAVLDEQGNADDADQPDAGDE
ncbi:type II toxin-antitoxin system VapC family toxin [Mycobacterium conspicuum]|jgi:ribonuclease VapC|uniref:Ribonuclease VapC n=1 Tax=Mycobacterium conspicuum TaxID=44010 RepID=A0A1X1TFI7_9MYCO|nr:type II toxin-antitoxin system VapC family toxin [Mycobacterium conspicuum]ORV43309.1 ribonuclease VapC [Mycobacterium conspicuum]BBZ39088.1 ribonuclease VapC30 [Mycobacterium conspicuum]